MGREVKRVPLDFDWPMGVTWKGFVNPYNGMECKLCDGSGLNPETKLLSNQWYTHLRSDGQDGWGAHLEQEDVQALLNADRLYDFTRVPINDEQRKIVEQKVAKGENNWLPFNNGYIPTAEEVNKWNRSGFGHDSINHWICVRARAKRLGYYGQCSLCNGNGYYFCEEKYEKLSDDWQQIEPPEGDGWQMWESVTEGSPMSPVFETPEKLAEWLTGNNASSFGSRTATYEQWLKMIKAGWAIDAIAKVEKGKMEFKSGVELS